MARISLVLLFALLVSLADAFSASTFCKCTCFTNSTIIPLGPQKHDSRSLPGFAHATVSDAADAADAADSPLEVRSRPLDARAASSSCSQCNRAFCLNYNLPICKDAEDKDVVTMCFQRDSRKDQIIVWFFLLGTGGLLGWTAVQKILAVRAARAAAREPLLSHNHGHGGSSGRGPLASPRPADTGPRGQYAPLDGSGD